MSEQNRRLVEDVLEQWFDGNLEVMEEHPGLHELIPNMKMLQEVSELESWQLHEMLTDGDWVVVRVTSQSTVLQDYMNYKAGEHVSSEFIGMYRVVDGVIVKQHSQGGRISG